MRQNRGFPASAADSVNGLTMIEEFEGELDLVAVAERYVAIGKSLLQIPCNADNETLARSLELVDDQWCIRHKMMHQPAKSLEEVVAKARVLCEMRLGDLVSEMCPEAHLALVITRDLIRLFGKPEWERPDYFGQMMRSLREAPVGVPQKPFAYRDPRVPVETTDPDADPLTDR